MIRSGDRMAPADRKVDLVFELEAGGAREHVQAEWEAALCNALFDLEIKTLGNGPFSASIRKRQFASIPYTVISVVGAQSSERTKQDVARSSEAKVNLMQMTEGRTSFESHGEQVVVDPGDILLLDSRVPYRQACLGRSCGIMFHLPLSWARTAIPTIEDPVLHCIRGKSRWAPALNAVLDEINTEDDPVQEDTSLVLSQLSGALALALGKGSAANPPLLAAIYASMSMAAFDTTLRAEQVAEWNGISLRYLHMQFAQANTTYRRTLLRLRLSKAAELLSADRFGALSIAEIGWRSGFSDESHFRRRFREAYGVTAAAYRRSPVH